MAESYSVEAILSAVDKNFSRVLVNAGESIKDFGKKTEGLTKGIGLGMIGAGVGISALGKTSLEAFGQFEASLNKAAIVAGGTSKDIAGLAEVANKMGADLPLSANDAAEAMVTMAQNGASLDQIKQQFPAIAQAATAAGSDLLMTAGVVQQAMNIWGKSLESPEQAAAILTKSANLSNASVESMETALATVGSTAIMAGMDLGTTSTAIGLLTNTGKSSAVSAQQLNHAILQMVAPNKKAARTAEELGLSFKDAEGKMKPFPQILEEVNAATSHLTEADKTAKLKAMFNTPGMQAMAPLLRAIADESDNTATSWKAYAASLGEVTSTTEASVQFLSASAEEMQQNLGSKLERVGGSWESLRNKSMSESSTITGGFLDSTSSMMDWASQSDSGLAKLTRGFIGLSPVIGPAVSSIGTFVFNLQNISSVAGGTMSSLGKLGTTASLAFQSMTGSQAAKDALAGLAQHSRLAAAAQTVLNGAWLASPITWLIVGLVALGAAFIYLWNTNEGFREAIISGWEKIVAAVQPAIDSITNLIQSVWGSCMSWWESNSASIMAGIQAMWTGLQIFFQGIWQAILGIVQIAVGLISGIINTVMALIKGDWQGAWEAIKTAAGQVWDGICNLIGGLLTTLLGIIMAGLGVIRSVIQAGVSVVVSLFTGIVTVIVTLFQGLWDGLVIIWNGICSAIGVAIEAANSVINSVLTAIGQFWSDTWNSISQLASDVWNSIVSTVDSCLASAQATIDSVLATCQGIFDTIFNTILTIVTTAGENLSANFTAALETMSGLVSGIIDGVKGVIEGIGNIDLFGAGQAIIDGFLRGLKSLWGDVQNFVGDIASWIAKNKGPISYDRKLLIPAGRAIMGGFDQALGDGFARVQDRVSGMASGLQSRFAAGIQSDMSFQSEVRHQAQPAEIHFSLGGRDFSAFVADISQAQGQAERIRLKSSRF